MGNKTVKPAITKKLTSSFIKKLTEALMVKTGIKSGPEFTGGH